MKPITIHYNGLDIHAKVESDYFETQWLNVENGTYEPLTYKVFDKNLDKNTIYIDLGAYVGYTCLYAAQLAKKAYAFEPDPVAFQYLQANVESNPAVNNLTIFQQAVGDKEGVVHIMSSASGGNSGSSLLLKNYKSSWEVKMIDLNRFINEHCQGSKLFIKIDIEGFEYHLLPLMKETILKFKPTMLLAMHPQIIANSVQGNTIIKKIQRRSSIVAAHRKLLSILSLFPKRMTANGQPYALNLIRNNILKNGMLNDADKDILLSF